MQQGARARLRWLDLAFAAVCPYVGAKGEGGVGGRTGDLMASPDTVCTCAILPGHCTVRWAAKNLKTRLGEKGPFGIRRRTTKNRFARQTRSLQPDQWAIMPNTAVSFPVHPGFSLLRCQVFCLPAAAVVARLPPVSCLISK
ncbi:uncharacterized protein B0I36DRAFT_28306 [Microdochium trichocladiopsis]|uniref:Secreted protein n=1 Tax=Microdochium trichocladiopsis TaxID=1682393 RepID=A0A9P8XV56_9PEZI|nr:uncharacterized protein B0I36DRAFT_28306 [Microdochium trichocladiopsis]KAH7021046.1 hypothetical protein B0I36DRAFT_28306 [Microdochium trichocladiopsis]